MCGILNQHARKIAWMSSWLILATLLSGCTRVRIPGIDPTGQRILMPPPNSTTLAPLPGGPLLPQNPNLPSSSFGAPVNSNPAFTQPPPVPPCNATCGSRLIQRPGSHPLVLPRQHEVKRRGPQGSIIMTPSRIIAPVGAEVVVLAGLCGGDGKYIINQPLEWMLSNDSVGQIIEVGGTDHQHMNRLIKPSAQKVDGEYAWGRTSLKPRLISRGTETKVDDLQVLKGQSWISLSSASSGTSYVTCVALKTNAWDKRKASTIIHWVDASWAIPAPSFAKAGQVAPLNVAITRTGDGGGVSDWKVRYQIVGGAPAEFLPDGAQTAHVTTDERGQASVRIQQPGGQVAAGTTQIRVDVIQPASFGQRELVVESGMTSITWSAPALTIRAIGPREAGIDQPYAYRLEVFNPGDQVAKDVVVRTKDFSDDVKYISSNPKPSQYGNQYEWKIGDLGPRSQPTIIDIQLKSDKLGTAQLCFEVSSQTEQLRTEACAQTQIAGPCIGLKISGPPTAKVGDTVSFDIEMVNECDFALENVVVEVTHGAGMVAPGVGSQTMTTQPIPSMEFNVPRKIPVQFQMTEGGIRCFDVVVKAKDGHTARGRKCIEVLGGNASRLELSLESTQVIQVGRKFQSRTTVKNNGTTMLTNVNVVNRYSDSLTLQKVSNGVTAAFNGDDFNVSIGNLAAGAQSSYVLEFSAVKVDGNAFVQSSALSTENSNDTKRSSIRIEPAGQGDAIGIPNSGGNSGVEDGQGNSNLSVNVRSLNNQVRRGQESKFQVTVTNKLSTAQQGVQVTLFVPPGLRYKRMEQNLRPATGRSPDGTEVYIEPIAEMRQFGTYTFIIVVEALEVGRPILEVRASSSQSTTAKGTASMDVNEN